MKWSTALFILMVCLGCASFRPKSINGEKCMKQYKMQIVQILDHGILANLCPKSFAGHYDDAFDACALEGSVIYMPVKLEEHDYVDNQKLTLPSNQCFSKDGVYKSITNNKKPTRIRKVKMLDKNQGK